VTEVVLVANRKIDKASGKLVGKPLATYVLAAMEALSKTGSVLIQARGRAISRACDVAAILERKKLGKISNIKIGTSLLKRDDKEVFVTEIEIEINAA